ncbi:MAG: deoxynucleoside kinase [Gammaproteobacteria bacterium]|nr:deoxynucleoside kinase [Gammaproteobacteria bacterium]NNF60285.1 deoxynucleoside kinase [Gammaproteobacteria bacterium]NNM20393.1 deoxynucleoside kinase [Gammaproteobacteria bacterium]
MWQPKYIAVEGPIGVGKTTLASRLAASFDAELVLEEPQDNPFLERFYRDPRRYSLPTQLYFIFQRARQYQAMRQADMFEPVRVTDFLLEKDRLFAQLNLDDDELALYDLVYEKLAIDAPVPDLVVYLQAPAEILLKRIATRGIGYEQGITREYMERVSEAYARFFHHYDRSSLLIVNTGQIDLVNTDSGYATLLEQLRGLRPGRHFFNPGPAEFN